MKKILKYAGFGFILGIAVSSMITAFICGGMPAATGLIEAVGSVKTALILQLLLSGIYGAICMGTVLVYENDRLPLALSSLIHCLCCVLPFIPLSLFLRWIDSIGNYLIMTASQLIAYFIVWLIMFIRYKKETEKLNEIHNQLKNKLNTEDKNK